MECNGGHQHLLLHLISSSMTISIWGLLSGASLVQANASLASFKASDSENFPWRFSSTRSSSLPDSAPSRIKWVILRFPLMTWNTITPKAYTSLLSVNRPTVVYSGARYPMAALDLRVEKTTSSTKSLCSPESESRGLKCWSMRTFSADMFWWTRAGLLGLMPCKYSMPVLRVNRERM